MHKISRPRDILDSAKLATAIADLVATGGASDAERRSRLKEILLAARQRGLDAVRRRFERGAGGLPCAQTHSFLMDGLLAALHDFAVDVQFPAPNPTSGDRLCLVALGGYGRGELAPYSDIDLLFVHPYKLTARGEQVVEFILYMLWDLGLKVGHATRSVDECVRLAKDDHTIRTALLESRRIWGEAGLFDELHLRFRQEVLANTGPKYAAAKLAERDERHRRTGDSRYLLEPNIKEGKGGLRDLHTLYWIAKDNYSVRSVGELVSLGVLTKREAAAFAKAEAFLWTLRFHIHYLTERAEERLTFDLQPEIARRMGYTDHAGTKRVERFMKHYFLVAKDVGDLTRIFCAAIEAEGQRRPIFSLARLGIQRRVGEAFRVDGGRLTVASDDMFESDPANFLRIFREAQARNLDIHPNALRLMTRSRRLVDAGLRDNPEANRLFLEILTAPEGPERALRLMNEAGVLGRFIPDFGRVVAQSQHDMYHVYTVDEHTLRALGILHRIESGTLAEDHPLASRIVQKVVSRSVLYLAVMLHDIAKGRGGSHSELGAAVAEKLCPRLGLGVAETETVAWLVLNHLAMSNVAQKRDLNDPKTISDFVAAVQSPERLRLLLVLTVADMRATGPNVWNTWKAALLRQLYYSVEEVMLGSVLAETQRKRVAAVQAELRASLADWSDEDFAQHVARGHASYWLAHDVPRLARHARMVRDVVSLDRPLAIQTEADPARGVTEVTICAPDHPGLFSELAGAFALSGANVLDARIYTLLNGLAVDTFWIEEIDGGAFERPDRLAKLAVNVERLLSGERRYLADLPGRRSLPSRAHVFTVAPRVLIDNKVSDAFTVFEVNGRDRPGLLYDLTRALTGVHVQISTARISTYGERVVDVFYVKDIFGLKIEHEGKLRQIRDALMAVLVKADEASVAAADAAPKKRGRRLPGKRPRRAVAAE